MLFNLFGTQRHADLLIAGLGNPGQEFAHSPHNAGFAAIDELRLLLKEEGADMHEHNHKEAFLAEVYLGRTKILLLKPLTYMNESGRVIERVLSEYHLDSDKLWVAHDDIDLPLGVVRVSFDSRSGGNRGVMDIIEKLDTLKFYRFRIGAGNPAIPEVRAHVETSKYVTTPLQGEQRKKLGRAAARCAELIFESLRTDKKPPLGTTSLS